MSTPTTKWFLYIIRCNDNTLYTGITTDVARRFSEHQSGLGARYLRGKGPLQLVFKTKAGTRATASKLEYQVKHFTKEKKEQLVLGNIKLKAILKTVE